jgi:hypothetical protein
LLAYEKAGKGKEKEEKGKEIKEAMGRWKYTASTPIHALPIRH